MIDRRRLFLLLGLLIVAGVGLIVLATIGDAAVIAATGGVQGALDRAGQGGNAPLRNDLFGVVLRLRGPWAIVQGAGMVVVAVAAAALWLVRRGPR